jgi:hypothetical protein
MDATSLMQKAMNAMKGGKSRKAHRKAHRKTQRKSRKSSRKMKGGNNMANMPNMPANNMGMMGGATRAVGTRAEVMHGTAHHTSGGLTKKDLKYNKRGRIVSRRASEAGRKALRRLTRAGYKARKGKFTLFKRKH